MRTYLLLMLTVVLECCVANGQMSGQGGTRPSAEATGSQTSSRPDKGNGPASKTTTSATAPAGRQEAMLNLLRVRQAWAITQGSKDVIVGVIDNGFDFFHPALKNKLIPGYYYPEGYHTECASTVGHGTMMASIIVAQKIEENGMTGLAPGCTVLTASQGMIQQTMVKLVREWQTAHPTSHPSPGVWPEIMRGHEDELRKFGQDWVRYQFLGAVQAIRYLADHGARVINISGGFMRSVCPEDQLPGVWKEVEDAFDYALQKDVVIVLSSGNQDALVEDYPGTADTVIIAGASDLDDTRWVDKRKKLAAMGMKQGSCFGKRLTVLAPAQDMMECVPHEKRFYSCDDGPMGREEEPFEGPYLVEPIGATSSAAPIVSSLAALVLSVRPDLGVRDVVAIIKAGADDIGEKGFDIYTGYGRVNFAKTLGIAQTWQKGQKAEGR